MFARLTKAREVKAAKRELRIASETQPEDFEGYRIPLFRYGKIGRVYGAFAICPLVRHVSRYLSTLTVPQTAALLKMQGTSSKVVYDHLMLGDPLKSSQSAKATILGLDRKQISHYEKISI